MRHRDKWKAEVRWREKRRDSTSVMKHREAYPSILRCRVGVWRFWRIVVPCCLASLVFFGVIDGRCLRKYNTSVIGRCLFCCTVWVSSYADCNTPSPVTLATSRKQLSCVSISWRRARGTFRRAGFHHSTTNVRICCRCICCYATRIQMGLCFDGEHP